MIFVLKKNFGNKKYIRNIFGNSEDLKFFKLLKLSIFKFKRKNPKYKI